jgi:hypothetical protein
LVGRPIHHRFGAGLNGHYQVQVVDDDNDLNENINRYIQCAMADEEALIYAFGVYWEPENNKKDEYFGFKPGNGIHDIHMNQGNVGQFVGDEAFRAAIRRLYYICHLSFATARILA